MLQRLLAAELLLNFVLCLSLLLLLILLGRLVQMRDLFVGQDLGLLDILGLFSYLLPFFLVLLIPVSAMLAVYLTFLRLGNDHEMLALKAGGLGLWQLLPAPGVLLALAVAANLLVAQLGLPWGLEHFRDAVLDMAKKKAQLLLQPGIFNADFPGLTIFAERYDADADRYDSVFIRDARGQDTPGDATKGPSAATILARHSHILTDRQAGILSFVLEDGSIYREDGDRLAVLGFHEYLVNLDLSRLTAEAPTTEVRPKEMTMSALRKVVRDDAEIQDRRNFVLRAETELAKRWALPAGAAALGLSAIPLACIFVGLRQNTGLLLAMGLFLFYYSLFHLANTMGESGRFNPWLGFGLVTGLFLLLALAGLHFTAREKSIDLSHVGEDLGRWLRRRRGRA